MSGDLKDMRAYARGYVDGQRSKDADRAAVAMRLRGLRFDGGSHENLSKIAYAVYPCATGWTCESSEGLRDRLIDLLGGVHEHHCDSGRCCARVDSHACGVGEPTEAMTYDVLGNERNKAVCELRNARDSMSDNLADNVSRIICAIDARPEVGERVCEAIADRLIHLLGGDTTDSQESPILVNSGNDDAGEITITGELREFATDPLLGYASQELHVERITAIADRIDEQFDHIYHQQGAVLQSAISYLTEECNKLHAECDQLRAKLEEADAAIANWRERERSFEESERERDELQKRLDEMREQREHWASEATKIYRLFFPHEEYGMPNEPSEMVVHKINELQDKLDAIREALDGNH